MSLEGDISAVLVNYDAIPSMNVFKGAPDSLQLHSSPRLRGDPSRCTLPEREIARTPPSVKAKSQRSTNGSRRHREATTGEWTLNDTIRT